MRTAFAFAPALLALAGCRAILGIDDVSVGGSPSPDSPMSTIDAPLDASIDATAVGCPGNYAGLANSGPRGHRYLLLGVSQSWSAQQSICAMQGTFLAFPDGVAASNELAALVTLVGNGGWVGVSDITTEGSYRTTLNMPVSTATAALIQASGNPNGTDCLTGTTIGLEDEDCFTSRKAACECVP